MTGITEETKRFIATKLLTGIPGDTEKIEEIVNSTEDCRTPAQFKEYCINYALERYNDEEKKDI